MSSDQSGDESFRRGVAAPARRGRDSALLIVHVYPHLLGTYGDAGNALVLHRRAQLRGIDAEIVPVHPGDRLPRTGDVYLLGGGEDAKQTAAAQELRDDGGLAVAARSGAAIVGICAGYQLLGETFLGVGGATTPGLGLLDVRTGRLDHRAVGNMLADPVDELGVPTLIGFENHGGATHLGPGAQPLGRVRVGVGERRRRHRGRVRRQRLRHLLPRAGARPQPRTRRPGARPCRGGARAARRRAHGFAAPPPARDGAPGDGACRPPSIPARRAPPPREHPQRRHRVAQLRGGGSALGVAAHRAGLERNVHAGVAEH